MARRARWLVGPLAAVLAVPACAGGDRERAAPATTARGPTAEARHTGMTVTPARGLGDGDVVEVVAAGFAPGDRLGLTQCADLGEATAAGDCDLAGVEVVVADERGTVRTRFTVRAGPFGMNGRVCRADRACVLSLGALSPDPAARRVVATIRFR